MTEFFPGESILSIETEEEYPSWCMYFDGVVHVHGNAICSPTGTHFPIATKLRFLCTNIIAEYKACIAGLKAALDMSVKDLRCREFHFNHKPVDRRVGNGKPGTSQIHKVFNPTK